MDYFAEYIQAKLSLFRMIGKFYSQTMSVEDAIQAGIDLTDEDVDKNYMSVDVCFHNYDAAGLVAWKYLDLTSNYLTQKELDGLEYKMVIQYSNDEKNETFDYEQEYYKICILLIDLVCKHYEHTISVEEAKDKKDLLYDKYWDVEDGRIVYYDLGNDTDNHIWNLFKFNNSSIGKSIFQFLRETYVDKIQELQSKDAVREDDSFANTLKGNPSFRDWMLLVDRDNPSFTSEGYIDGFNNYPEVSEDIVKQLYNKITYSKLTKCVSEYLQGYEVGKEIFNNISDVYDEDGNMIDKWANLQATSNHVDEAIDAIKKHTIK